MAYGNNIIVSSDLVLNTDLGLLKLIKEKFNNSKYINMGMLDIPDKNLILELLNRDDENPLSIIIQDNYRDQIDSLRVEFIANEYEEILKLSPPTDILNLLSTFLKTDLIHVTILCKNVLEEQFIKTYTEQMTNINILRYEKLNDLILDNYDSVFIRNYKEVLEFKNIKGKSIFIGKYKFNLEDNKINEIIPLLDVSAIIGNMNRVFIIDVYTIDDSYIALG